MTVHRVPGRGWGAGVALGATLALLATRPLGAQEDSLRIAVTTAVAVGTPIASFGKRVDAAIGLQGGLRIGRDREQFAWRVGASALLYGHESKTTCVTTGLGCRVNVGVTTTNQIWSLETGPELRWPFGRAELRGHVSAGGSLMVTNTGLTGDYDLIPLLSKRELADGGFVWGGGISLSYPVATASPLHPSLEFEASYRQHGLRRYLVDGGITETTGGVLRDVQRSNVSLVQWQLGLSLRPQPKAKH